MSFLSLYTHIYTQYLAGTLITNHCTLPIYCTSVMVSDGLIRLDWPLREVWEQCVWRGGSLKCVAISCRVVGAVRPFLYSSVFQFVSRSRVSASRTLAWHGTNRAVAYSVVIVTSFPRRSFVGVLVHMQSSVRQLLRSVHSCTFTVLYLSTR